MTRREAIRAAATMVGGAAAFGAPSARAARQGPATNAVGDPTLPELMKGVGPMMAQVPVKAEPLGPGLKLVTGPGGNVLALEGPDGLMVVDSFVPGHVDALMAALGGPAGRPITLFDTHWHFDHAGGNPGFAALGAKIVAHANARKRLAAGQVMAEIGAEIPPDPPASLPVVGLEGPATYYLNGEQVRVVGVPAAHTDGDMYFHLARANVLHTGDLMTNGSYPFIDGSSGGWIGGMVEAADAMLAATDGSTRIVPGHGPLASRGDLATYRSMLAEVRDKIQPMVEAGKTVDEVLRARPTARLDPSWGKGLMKGSHFATLAYNGLLKHHQLGK